MALSTPEWLQHEGPPPPWSTPVIRFVDLPPLTAERGTVLVAAGGWCAPMSPLYDLLDSAGEWAARREAELELTAEWAGDLLEQAGAPWP